MADFGFPHSLLEPDMKYLRVSAWMLRDVEQSELPPTTTHAVTSCLYPMLSQTVRLPFRNLTGIEEINEVIGTWVCWEKSSSLLSCTACFCNTWSAPQELLWDAANTDPNLSTCHASCTIKLILNSRIQQLADIFWKLTYISTLRLGQHQNENKVQKRKSQLKDTTQK